MKKILIATLFSIASTFVIAQKSTVSGIIKGMKHDTITIMFLPLKQGETPIIDKVVCKNEKLNYEVQLVSPLPHLVRISSKKWETGFSGNTYPFHFERDDVNFFIKKGEQINFRAEPGPNGIFLLAFGSPINEQRNVLFKKLFPLYQKLNAACLKYVDSKKSQDSLKIKYNMLLPGKIIRRIESGTIGFIQKHPDWEISAEVLMTLPIDSCYKYFRILDSKVQTSFFGRYAAEVLFAMKPGDKAISFSLPDQQGKLISLEEFKGNYVVLEFWGTWCGWCVKDIPTMRQYHNKYKSKANFVSIACKDQPKKWKEALQKYKMDWTNLLNNDEQLTKSYGIEGYPTKIIINPEGIVVGKFLGEGREFYTELDKMFKD